MGRIVGGAVLVLGVIALLVYLVMAFQIAKRTEHAEAEFISKFNDVVKLGDESAAAMADADVSGLSDFREACDAVMASGEPAMFVSYFPAVNEAAQKQAGDEASALPQKELVGASDYDTSGLKVRAVPWDPSVPITDRWIWHFATNGPSSWEHVSQDHLRNAPSFDKAKFLLVHNIREVKMPVVIDEDSFVPGSAFVHVRAIGLADKKTVCEGRLALRSVEVVKTRGSGSTDAVAKADLKQRTPGMVRWAFCKSILLSAIDGLCAKGGEKLCERTAYHFEWIN